jgi:3'-5' exoribonuclease
LRRMKSHFVVDLSDGQIVVSHFLVREKEVRTSMRTGSSWLQLELVDRTGAISGKMWENFAALVATFDRDDVVQIRGRVKLFNGQKELSLEQIIPVLERDYDLSDFLPHTKHDVEKMYAVLRAAVAGMKNPWLKRLLDDVVEDAAIAPRLKRAPAAMTMHHAFLGGLLEHVVSLIGLAAALTAHYTELDADLLLAGVILHDIGKIDELRYARGIDYSTEGRLLGHIMIGVSMVHEKIKAIAGFPPQLAVLLEHLIVSHHGSHEFGSPALPQTREAVALHFLDDMDSKMGAMRATLDVASLGSGASVWTDRNPSLRRALLRADKFLAEDCKPVASKSGDAPNYGAAADASGAADAPKAAEKDTSRKEPPGLFHG